MAARGENPNIIKLLLEEGADPSSTDENSESCLHNSVEIQSVENTRLLIEAGAQLEARNLSDETPLILAVRHLVLGSRDLVKLLLEYGANPDAKLMAGCSCLHMAVSGRDVLKVRMLLERASMEVRGSRIDSVLHYAAHFVDIDGYVLEFLLAKHEDRGTLRDALAARNENGRTPLHVAASVGNNSTLKMLMKYGASVETKDEDGDTPLPSAIEAVRDHCRQFRFSIFKGRNP